MTGMPHCKMHRNLDSLNLMSLYVHRELRLCLLLLLDKTLKELIHCSKRCMLPCRMRTCVCHSFLLACSQNSPAVLYIDSSLILEWISALWLGLGRWLAFRIW